MHNTIETTPVLFSDRKRSFDILILSSFGYIQRKIREGARYLEKSLELIKLPGQVSSIDSVSKYHILEPIQPRSSVGRPLG